MKFPNRKISRYLPFCDSAPSKQLEGKAPSVPFCRGSWRARGLNAVLRKLSRHSFPATGEGKPLWEAENDVVSGCFLVPMVPRVLLRSRNRNKASVDEGRRIIRTFNALPGKGVVGSGTSRNPATCNRGSHCTIRGISWVNWRKLQLFL